MSKYSVLWEYVKNDGRQSFIMTFDEIAAGTGFDIDHSFLTFKKELTEYGYTVKKISMKNKTVEFEKTII